ncbi:hypothetical protein EDD21DRAFT_374168 [Dissophora ornata]|nr:hypothetical protein EDD21DRAFT_374168 [Dissophora ornata]
MLLLVACFSAALPNHARMAGVSLPCCSLHVSIPPSIWRQRGCAFKSPSIIVSRDDCGRCCSLFSFLPQKAKTSI